MKTVSQLTEAVFNAFILSLTKENDINQNNVYKEFDIIGIFLSTIPYMADVIDIKPDISINFIVQSPWCIM